MNKDINTAVIYHYNDDTGGYEKYIFKNATAHNLIASAVQDHGFVSSNTFKIRIFTRMALNICAGDYILLCTPDEARCAQDEPDKSLCKKISAYSDNRIGLRPHWRIEAV